VDDVDDEIVLRAARPRYIREHARVWATGRAGWFGEVRRHGRRIIPTAVSCQTAGRTFRQRRRGPQRLVSVPRALDDLIK